MKKMTKKDAKNHEKRAKKTDYFDRKKEMIFRQKRTKNG